ncbi:hypothetical protein ABDK00_003460 [Niabella insulamsoli]|uniref:hypothetical protein n=1 Tax=Niabella insulamsoli TaxID=3144874 RepID=UPI0031FD9594
MPKSTDKKTDPIDSSKEVKESKDPKIDQDMPGFPHHPSSQEDLKKEKPTRNEQKK